MSGPGLPERLPAGWTAAALGDCCEVVGGATPRTSVDDYWGGGIAWITPKDLSDLGHAEIGATSRTLTPAGLASCGATLLPPDSVLFSSRAPIGLVAINTVPMATNQGFKSLIPHPNRLSTRYLYWWLKTHTRELQALGRGATFKEVSKAIVSDVRIPLPPLPEQRRIAAILDHADSLRAKRRQALDLLDTLTQSIFIDMFGDPAVNCMGWPEDRLGALSLKFADGPFGSNLKSSHYVDEPGIRVVRLQNIGVGRFIDDERAYITTEHFGSLEKHACQPGDVLIATLGDPNLRACLQPNWLTVALNKADCVQMRVDPQRAIAEWVVGLLNTRGTLHLAARNIQGQTRLRISMGRLREVAVPVPPLGRQIEYANRVAALSQQEGFSLAATEGQSRLSSALQHRAFRGEL